MGLAPNKFFPLIIIAMIANHDVSKILVDKWSSLDVTYEEIFTKLYFTRDVLASHKEQIYSGYNGTITHP